MSGRREPERTCAGCRERAPKRHLLRVARAPDGKISVDPAGRAPGRGAYVHRNAECVDLALRRGALARALEAGPGPEELARLRSDIEELLV